MNWIEVVDKKQLPYDRSILAQDQTGHMGVVYWNSYEWVYDIQVWDMDEIGFSGEIVRYVVLDPIS
jgi:hypothetical protein